MNLNTKNKKLTLTVGITTCYGDESILDSVRSIRGSKGVGSFRFIIVADRNPVKEKVAKELKKLEVELIENKVESGQIKKKRQIIAMADSDILLLTNDDVLFDSSALKIIINEFERDSKVTLISIKNTPIVATSLFESIATVGTQIVNRIAKYWNKGDNYLSVIGRCEAIRTDFIKKWGKLPDEVATSDAYFYFANKKYGGKYKYIKDVSVYFKNPQNYKEYLRKSSRFQYSQMEMSRYFQTLSSEYKVPKTIAIRAILEELKSDPIKTVLYFGVYLYSRLHKLTPEYVLNANWEIDLSTKKIQKSYESK